MAIGAAEGLSARERLRQLAIVFAVEIRLKIVVELYMREMSAPQFYLAFGGGSKTRIHQNFRVLDREGWLRHLYDEGPGGALRGGTQQVYRATKPPIMDSESWSLLPFSVRATSSWNLHRQIAPRLRENLESVNSETEFMRDLTCSVHKLDSRGYDRAIGALRSQFARFFEEQEDARRRSVQTGEKLMRSDAYLIAFEPSRSGQIVTVDNSLFLECSRDLLAPFSVRLAPILRDDVRLAILDDLDEGETSVTQFHREIGGASKPAISRRFKGLEDGGWLAKSGFRTGGHRRGAREQFFRATRPALHGCDPCHSTSSSFRESDRWATLQRLCRGITEALDTGTFDARPDRCFTWSLLSLDRLGWERVYAGIEALASIIKQEEADSRLRIARSGETPIEMMVALGAFEAPSELTKAF